MTRTARAALVLVLICGLCNHLSAQSAFPAADPPPGPSHIAAETRSPVPSVYRLSGDRGHQVLVSQGFGNPPAAVRQPSSKTRLITAILCVASIVALGVVFHNSR